MHKSNFDIDIDILGACNLRCPSCPQGNVKDYRLSQGFMAPELLERIVEKAQIECQEARISLYNWAEPLLHPQLADMIGIIQNAGISCHLSSNLNILPDADAIMAANPASFRISNSGFTQEVYGRTHRGGNIEKVRKHMIKLAETKKRNHATTDIYVYYHRYLNNLEEESQMRKFATDLGFYFHAVWALFFPLEKILTFAGESISDFPVTEEDRALINSLALPLGKALSAASKYKDRPCTLREDSISLDFQGNFTLCCGIFDARKYSMGNYMDMPLAEIQKLRQSHPLCRRCMNHGCHVYLTYDIDDADDLALANIPPEDVKHLDLRYEITWERWQQNLEKFYNRFFSRVFSRRQKAALADRFFSLKHFLRRIRREKTHNG